MYPKRHLATFCVGRCSKSTVKVSQWFCSVTLGLHNRMILNNISAMFSNAVLVGGALVVCRWAHGAGAAARWEVLKMDGDWPTIVNIKICVVCLVCAYLHGFEDCARVALQGVRQRMLEDSRGESLHVRPSIQGAHQGQSQVQ